MNKRVVLRGGVVAAIAAVVVLTGLKINATQHADTMHAEWRERFERNNTYGRAQDAQEARALVALERSVSEARDDATRYGWLAVTVPPAILLLVAGMLWVAAGAKPRDGEE